MAKNKDKRMKPKMSMEHELVRPSAIWGQDRFIEKARFDGGEMPDADGERLVFDNCVFKDMSFANGDWRGVEFVDVIFQTCDLSNVQMENIIFHRCEIVNSKLTGANLANSHIGHLLVKDSDVRYSNFNFSELKEVEFADCNLIDSDFYECLFNEVRFEKCKLDDTNFLETDLDGVDLSDNTYERIEVTVPKIAGCIVSREQALGFARAIGLTIKEE